MGRKWIRMFIMYDLCLKVPSISRFLLHEIVTEYLHYTKLCLRWVPKMLISQKMKHMGASLDFSIFWWGKKHFKYFLRSIITDDEICVYHATSESKQWSLQWQHMDSSNTKKFKTTFSIKKIMYTVFWGPPGNSFHKHSNQWRSMWSNSETVTVHLQNKKHMASLSSDTVYDYTLLYAAWYESCSNHCAGNNSVIPLQSRLSTEWSLSVYLPQEISW